MPHIDGLRRPGDDPHWVTPPRESEVLGFQDYNNTSGDFLVPADTWTTVTNNGAGAFTNLGFTVDGVPSTMNGVGQLTFEHLAIGDTLLIRTDLTVNPTVNGVSVGVRWGLGSDFPYNLETSVGRIDDGAGTPKQFVFLSYIYVGDENTRNGLGTLQINCSSDSTVNNAGSAIQLFVRGV